MPKRENLKVKIDYISIIFDNATVDDVIFRVLHLPAFNFTKSKCKVKYKTYQTLYQHGSIKVYGDALVTENNPSGLGCYLVLTGMGCAELNQLLEMDNLTFGYLFWHMKRAYEDSFHFTRLDIAIDDKNEIPYFTPEQIKRKCEKEEFISNSNSYRFVESYFSEKSTAKTVYIGTGSSNLSYRFCDKDKEISLKYRKPLKEIGSLKRTEMQLRDDKAHSFAMLLKDYPYDLGKLAFDLLSTNLRFVIPDSNQSNKSRWKTCQFWERFLGAVETLKFNSIKPQTTLLETQNWLKEGGVLAAVKAFSFLEENRALNELEPLAKMLKETRYSQNLCNKIVQHLNLINRRDLIPLVHQNTKYT